MCYTACFGNSVLGRRLLHDSVLQNCFLCGNWGAVVGSLAERALHTRRGLGDLQAPDHVQIPTSLGCLRDVQRILFLPCPSLFLHIFLLRFLCVLLLLCLLLGSHTSFILNFWLSQYHGPYFCEQLLLMIREFGGSLPVSYIVLQPAGMGKDCHDSLGRLPAPVGSFSYIISKMRLNNVQGFLYVRELELKARFNLVAGGDQVQGFDQPPSVRCSSSWQVPVGRQLEASCEPCLLHVVLQAFSQRVRTHVRLWVVPGSSSASHFAPIRFCCHGSYRFASSLIKFKQLHMHRNSYTINQASCLHVLQIQRRSWAVQPT